MTPPAGTHLVFDLSTNRPAPPRGFAVEFWRWVGRVVLRLGRFRVAGDWPSIEKAVIIAAPHTSNWDGIWMIGAAGKYRARLNWMGKKSLVTGPFGRLALATGCVPVDRSRSVDLVQQMADEFARRDSMLLAISPEGTREPVTFWKTGFWHIARAAGVPLIFAVMDYGTRTVRISGALWPTDDYAADLAVIRTHYADAQGRHPNRFTIDAAQPRD